MAKSNNGDSALIRRFVETFAVLDDSLYTHAHPPAEPLSAGIDPEDGNVIRWRPAVWQTPPDALAAIRRAGPLPVLYETLVVSYRWPEVNLGVFRLLPNEPASDLQPLADAMFADPVLNNTFLPARYVRFALAVDAYDPICFDLNRMAHGDCPIVRLEHESILMHDTIGACDTLFATFRECVLAVIDSTT